MFKAFGKFWSNYFNFKDRTRRKDFWLAYLAISICEAIVSGIASNGMVLDEVTSMPVYEPWASALMSIFSLLIFIPGLAITVRRLHDVGKSGWFILIGLIPIVGWIILLVNYCKAGTAGVNKYGEDPKAEIAVQ